MLDDVLLKEIRAGQEAALYQLYTQYRQKFISTLVKQHSCDVEQATEIYQISIILVHENILNRKFDKANNGHSLWNYLYKIGVHKFLLWHRKQKRILELPDELLDSIEQEGEEDLYHERAISEQLYSDQLQMIEQALASLGDPCTVLLEQFYYEKKSMTQIADELNYNNRESAKTQKYKCLKRLRKAFDKISKNNQ